MDERMTLERIKPTHWMDDLGRVCTAEFMASEKAHGDYQLAYCIPCVKQGRKFVRIDDAHLTQTAQAVDMGKVREVIAELTRRANTGLNTNDRARCGHWATQLTRAIGNAQAEVKELEAEARRLYNASVGDAHNLHCLAWSELSKDQQRKWISKASTTQATPNAHE